MANIFQRFRSPIHLALIIFLVVFCVYLPSFGNSFLWDDEQFIVKNIFTTSFQYIPQIFTTNTIEGAGHISNYYRPLTTLTFLFDRMIWGLHPFGFHLTNTVLHSTVVVLFFILLLRLGVRQKVAAGVALLYGLHPLNTEAVTYINSRGDSLFAAWLLMGVLAFESLLAQRRWRFTYDGHRYDINPAWQWVVALGAFVAAVLSKEIGVAGIGLYFLLAIWYWWRHPQPRVAKQASVILLTVSGLVAVYFGLRLTVLNFSNSLNFYPYQNEYTDSLAIRVLTFCRVLVEYLRLIVLPYPLHMERSVEFVTNLFSGWVWAVFGGLAGWIGLGIWEAQKRQTALILFGGGWFLGMLVPVSGIVPINGIMYEHWLYMPLMGLGLAGAGVWQALDIQKTRLAVSWMGGLVLLIWSALTIRQNWIWRHPIPFYTYTLQYAQSARLYNNLAMAYADDGKTGQAIETYQLALTHSNVYPQTYYNLARSLRENGQTLDAIHQAEKALEVDPSFFFAETLLIDLYLEDNQPAAALPHLESLLMRFPSDPILQQTVASVKQRAEEEAQK